MVDRLAEILQELSPLAQQHRPPPICWISDGDDTAADYCPECSEKRAVKLRTAGFPEAIADGGWDARRESDHTSCCASCGRDLGYSLTREGLISEIEHWLDHPCAPPLRPVDAYNVVEILNAAAEACDAELVADAVSIGEQAIATIRQIAAA